MAQVSRLVVVCLPAKKNVLHSSTMSDTGIGCDLILSVSRALIISPSRSRKPSLPSLLVVFVSCCSAASSLRRPMSRTSPRLISLSRPHDIRFFFVGKKLQQVNRV